PPPPPPRTDPRRCRPRRPAPLDRRPRARSDPVRSRRRPPRRGCPRLRATARDRSRPAPRGAPAPPRPRAGPGEPPGPPAPTRRASSVPLHALLAPPEEIAERPHVVAVRLHRDGVDREPAEELLARLLLPRDAPLKGAAHAGVRGVDLDDLAGLEVLEQREADVGQLLLARVHHLDGDEIVARGGHAERALVLVGDEVAHEEGDRL